MFRKFLFLSATVMVLASAVSCSSSRQDTASVETVSELPGLPVSARGILQLNEEGEAVVVSGGKTKNRRTVVLVPCEGYEEVYAGLSSFSGKSVEVTGRLLEMNSPWSSKMELVSIKE